MFKLSKNEEVDFFQLESDEEKMNFMLVNIFLAYKNQFDFRVNKFNEEIDCSKIKSTEDFYYILSRKLFKDSTFCICNTDHFDDFRIDFIKNNDYETLKSSILHLKKFDILKKEKKIFSESFQRIISSIPINVKYD